MRSSTARLLMPCSRNRWTRRSRVRAEVIPIPDMRRSAIDGIQPAGKRRQRGVAREIHLQWSHGHVTLRNGVEVGSRTLVFLCTGGTDPVDGASARILGAHRRLGAVSVAESTGAKTAQRLIGHVGYVDVEDERLQRLLLQLRDEHA